MRNGSLDIGVDNQLSARPDVGMRTLHRHRGKLRVCKSASLQVWTSGSACCGVPLLRDEMRFDDCETDELHPMDTRTFQG
jgi:hypothetical protein